MDHEFWLDKWRANQIGFHRNEVHPFLTEHWPAVGLAPGVRVLAPLCGKSVDLRWLAEAGHRVLGVELSELAVASFFAEHDLEPVIDDAGAFRRYRAGPIEMLAGDFFALGPETVGEIAAVYDRAALIALPPDQRRAYVERLCALAGPGAEMLLITLEYPPGRIKPPPFSVGETELSDLFRDRASIRRLGERTDVVKDQPCREFAYRLALT